MADPDIYESADATPDVSEFPVDHSRDGKHYQVAVPDYEPARKGKLNSYFRHGVPHSQAAEYDDKTKEWKQKHHSRELGDDLLKSVTPPNGFDESKGGVRDHTDGNRIVTTRLDCLEVIQGQYRQLVLSNQVAESLDPDWKPPSEGNDEEPSNVEHTYTNWYYEVISTAEQPHPKSFAEPRKKVHEAKEEGLDFYEYVNGKNLVEVYAGKRSLVEKLYGGWAYEVVSTVHEDHPGWETRDWGGVKTSDPKKGDLVDFLFAKNLTEVIRAEELLVDKIYASTLVEIISTWHINDFGMEVDPNSLPEGTLYEVMNAKADLVEIMRAKETFVEKIYGNNIFEEMVATLNFQERLEAGGSIEELTAAGGGINAITIAGGELVEVVMGGVLNLEVIAALGAIVEFIGAGLLNLEVTTGLAHYDLDVSKWHGSYHNFTEEWSLEKSEFEGVKTSIGILSRMAHAEHVRATTAEQRLSGSVQWLTYLMSIM